MMFKQRLPTYYSGEIAECGLICLAMIAGFYGHLDGPDALRRRFATSSRGMTLRDMTRIAGEIGMDARATRIELSEIRALALPAILHWELTHFVVVKCFTRRALVIHDPSSGEIRVPWSEASKSFTGIALELKPNTRFQMVPRRRRFSIRDMLGSGVSLLSPILKIVAISFLAQIVTLLIPFYSQFVIDKAVQHRDYYLLFSLTFIFCTLILVGPALNWTRSWSVQYISSILSLRAASSVMSHLLSLPIKFFEKRTAGDLGSRLDSIRSIHEFLAEGLITSLIDVFVGTTSAVFLMFINIQIGTLVIIGLLLTMIVGSLFQSEVNALSYADESAKSLEKDYQYQTLLGINSIKVFGGERDRLSAWSGLYISSLNANLTVARVRVTADEVRRTMLQILTLFLIFLSATSVMSGELTVGSIFAIITYWQILAERLEGLLQSWQKLGVVKVQIDRVADIMEAAPELNGGELSYPPLTRSIEFRGVSFSYAEHEPMILRNASITINDGDFIAITGVSGSGKTTALKLILGLYQPTAGTVVLGGQISTKVDMNLWREQLGVVGQEDQLFSGSITENITLFAPEQDQEKIRHVCAQAGILTDILAMPMAYNSFVGHMGSSLSGGQKQRLLMARALYRDPGILILDEGTANLDPEAESLIADLVEGLTITRVVIAHRPALVERAMRRFHLCDGALQEI